MKPFALADQAGARKSSRLGKAIFQVSFFRDSARTRLGKQFVSYPFHLTRPFTFDAQIPEFLTIYQQSSAGGLYRADQLSSSFTVGPGAAVHFTTQSATLVHDCQGEPARHQIEVDVQKGAFFAYSPDPLVLFPGAVLEVKLSIRVAEAAAIFAGETITNHDPSYESQKFDMLLMDTEVRGGENQLLCRERLRVSGARFLGAPLLHSKWKILGNYLFIGDHHRLPTRDTLEFSSSTDVALGVTALPNNGGWGIRFVASSASAARSVTERLFEISVLAGLGKLPTKRRK